MTGLKTKYSFEKGFVSRYELKGKIISQSIFIKNLIKFRMFHKCFDLRRKQKGLIHLRIVKRLDSKNIPCTEKSFFLCIPNHKRVHSPETIDKFLSPLLISVYQSFRICIRDKYMSSLDQFFSQFLIVIDFPIEIKHHAFIFIIKGLISD